MKNFRALSGWCIAFVLLAAGCTEEQPGEPLANKTPSTYLWLFPDSTIAQGVSRQHVRWWGEDPDGIIKGYLFTYGKIIAPGGVLPQPDTLRWTWTTRNDTLVAFPLRTKRDTFDVAVRGVDNRFLSILPEHAVIRLSPSPYWDLNDNGVFDGQDAPLQTLVGSYDLKGSALPMPIVNQPPAVVFAQNPNDPTTVMAQPETTFTAATFAWVGSDPDGDETIAGYEIALNDTSNESDWVKLRDNINLISVVVPRQRSDTATGEVTADLYTGKFSTVRIFDTTIAHLRLDALNTFYLRARDVAGDASPVIQLPSAGGRWYVKKPRSRLLIVSDYIGADSSFAWNYYRSTLGQFAGFENGEVLNIARGLTATQKKESKVGVLVPPFIDPAFVYTLHLFDLVFWFTDQFPSLAVAQYPLFQYPRDPVHHGKVIFSTVFESASDPRGALKDFAPIDSVSSVDLSNNRLLPTLGDTRVPRGYTLDPDSTDPGNLYPMLRLDPKAPNGNSLANYLGYLRPIYRRADAKYIYHMQADTRVPARYVYSPVITDLLSLASFGSDAWACGVSGAVLHSSDAGTTWNSQTASVGTTNTLRDIRFTDALNGWVVGDGGSIYQTQNGGEAWSNVSVITLENLYGVDFGSDTTAIVVGSNGLLIRSTNGGSSWRSPSSRTSHHLRSVRFFDRSNAIAVGDSGTVVKTTDAGITWSLIPSITSRALNAVRYATGTLVYAVGSSGTVLRSTDAGDSWIVQSPFTTSDLRGLSFLDQVTGSACGANGVLFRTNDGGATWSPAVTGISQPINNNGQILTNFVYSGAGGGIAAATGGIIIITSDGGATWSAAPRGNLEMGVIDGPGSDGKRSFAFISLPLHYLNGDGTNVFLFFEKVLSEFGL